MPAYREQLERDAGKAAGSIRYLLTPILLAALLYAGTTLALSLVSEDIRDYAVERKDFLTWLPVGLSATSVLAYHLFQLIYHFSIQPNNRSSNSSDH